MVRQWAPAEIPPSTPDCIRERIAPTCRRPGTRTGALPSPAGDDRPRYRPSHVAPPPAAAAARLLSGVFFPAAKLVLLPPPSRPRPVCHLVRSRPPLPALPLLLHPPRLPLSRAAAAAAARSGRQWWWRLWRRRLARLRRPPPRPFFPRPRRGEGAAPAVRGAAGWPTAAAAGAAKLVRRAPPPLSGCWCLTAAPVVRRSRRAWVLVACA